MSTVAKSIKKIRVQNNLTQEEVASKLFVTRQTVSNWENGKTQPDIDMLIKISETLGTDVTTLIYGVQRAKPEKKEIKKLFISAAILLLFGVAVHFLNRYGVKLKVEKFMSEVSMITQTLVVPIFWIVFGWILMQALSVMGVMKPLRFRYQKEIHAVIWGVIGLYFIIMLPYFIYLFLCLFKDIQFHQKPELYPEGFGYNYMNNLFSQIEIALLGFLYEKTVIFIIPSVLLWITKPPLKKQNGNSLIN